MSIRTIPAGLISSGFQSGSLNSTAVALTSTIRANNPTALLISIESRGARLRMDSTAPTANTGVLLSSTGSPYFFESFPNSANMRFVADQSTAGATYAIQAFHRVGDST